jgi:hypothetical protein
MSSLKIYEADITNKLNELYHCGYVTFYKWELLTWFNRERITSVVWTDLLERWNDLISESSNAELRTLSYIDSNVSFLIIDNSYINTFES